jgi:EpsI family protein
MNDAHRTTLSATAMCVLMLSAAGASVLLKPTAFLADQLPKIDLERQIPRVFGTWRFEETDSARVVNPQAETLTNRLYNQLMTRTYVDMSSGERVMVSIAYGKNQTDSLQVHRPEGCYPAQGFTLHSVAPGRLQTRLGAIPVRRLETSLGTARPEPVTYWTTIGKHSVMTHIDKKLYEIRYSLSGMIADGLLFRISSISADSAAAFATHERFVRDLLSELPSSQLARLAGLHPEAERE